ncbi:MAG: hypothetical protein WAZ40_00500 [Minisyncoccia bacterium]
MEKDSANLNQLVVKIIARFLKEIKEVDKKDFLDRVADPFSLERLRSLIFTLEELRADTSYWDQVATFVLKRGEKQFADFYQSTLLLLTRHVSASKRSEVVKYFCNFGNIDVVVFVTEQQCLRYPSNKELLTIAKYHRRHHTASTSDAWKKIVDLAKSGPNYRLELSAINKMLKEVRDAEENPSMY